MNNLSWFLYLADVIPGMFRPFIFMLGVAAILVTIFYFVALAMMGDSRIGSDDYKKADSMRCGSISYAKWIMPILALFVILQTLIPSRQTIYLIAGSEVGEVVVNSPEAREILNDVRTVIKQQIKEVTK